MPRTKAQLTPRQDQFAHEYCVDLNGAGAARRAGYSAKTADRIAVDLLRLPHVLARIVELQAERNLRVQVDADWIMVRLLQELDARVADLFDAEGRLLPAREWPEVWQRGLVTSVRTTTLYEKDCTGKSVEIGFMKDVTFADRVKRIELLGRHINVQAFKERVSLGVEDPLKALFEQIKGQSVRPAIEHQPSPGDRNATQPGAQPRPGLSYVASKP